MLQSRLVTIKKKTEQYIIAKDLYISLQNFVFQLHYWVETSNFNIVKKSTFFAEFCPIFFLNIHEEMQPNDL